MVNTYMLLLVVITLSWIAILYLKYRNEQRTTAKQLAATAATYAASAAASAATSAATSARAAATSDAASARAAATSATASASAAAKQLPDAEKLQCKVEIKFFGCLWYKDQLTLTKGVSLTFCKKEYNKFTSHSASILKKFESTRPKGKREYRVNVLANDKKMELAFTNKENLDKFCKILGQGFKNKSHYEESRGGM